MKQILQKKMLLLFLSLIVWGGTSCKKVTEEEVCLEVVDLKSGNITGTTADLTWTAAEDAVQYVVQYRKAGVSGFTEAGRPKTNTFSLTGLSKGTDYEWKVQTNCPGANSGYTATATFKTKTATELNLMRKWRIQDWKANGVALTLSAGDFAEFLEDGTYQQQLIGVTSSGNWQFNDATQSNIKINTGSASDWKIYEITESLLKMTKTNPSPPDSVVMIPF